MTVTALGSQHLAWKASSCWAAFSDGGAGAAASGYLVCMPVSARGSQALTAEKTQLCLSRNLT